MRLAIDTEEGALVVEGGARLGGSASPGDALAAFRGQAEPIEGHRHRVKARGDLAGRVFDIEIRFGARQLDQVWLLATDSSPDEHDALRAQRERLFLRDLLGPPAYENARGSMHAFAWGWVYSKSGAILLVQKRHPSPVPLPGQGRSEGESFRCCGCGHLMDLGYGRGILTAGLSRGGAPCAACGAVAWVQAGSMTEYYQYSQQPWVCEVGMHPADGVKLFRLKSTATPSPTPAKLSIAEVLIKACPAHVDALRRGFLGCYLQEGDQGEAPR
jgi:hypothetical protein